MYAASEGTFKGSGAYYVWSRFTLAPIRVLVPDYALGIHWEARLLCGRRWSDMRST